MSITDLPTRRCAPSTPSAQVARITPPGRVRHDTCALSLPAVAVYTARLARLLHDQRLQAGARERLGAQRLTLELVSDTGTMPAYRDPACVAIAIAARGGRLETVLVVFDLSHHPELAMLASGRTSPDAPALPAGPDAIAGGIPNDITNDITNDIPDDSPDAGDDTGVHSALGAFGAPGPDGTALREAVTALLVQSALTSLDALGLRADRVSAPWRLQDRRQDNGGQHSGQHAGQPNRRHSGMQAWRAALPHSAPLVHLAIAWPERQLDLLFPVGESLCATLADALDAARAHPLHDTGVLTTLRVPGALIVGRRTVSAGTLARLRCGDVILDETGQARGHPPLPDPDPDPDPATDAAGTRPSAPGTSLSVIAVWGTAGMRCLHARAELHRHQLILREHATMMIYPKVKQSMPGYGTAPTPSDAPPAAPPPASAEPAPAADTAHDVHDTPVRLDALDIPVQFEVDSLAMTLGELGALAPGYVIELPAAPAGACVQLVAHGRIIGRGELVTIGEHLGVRITQMATTS